MALKPGTSYPAQTDLDETNYPLGKARNVTTDKDGTGTPWERALINDLFGFQQALLAAGGVTASGDPDTAVASQYLQALQTLFAPKSKYILAAGNWNYAISWNGYSGTDWASANSEITALSMPVTVVAGDVVQVWLDLNAYTAGVGSVRLAWNENGTEVDPTTISVATAAVSNRVLIVTSHTITHAGTLLVLRGIGDGSNTFHVGLPCTDNNNFGNYQIVRP